METVRRICEECGLRLEIVRILNDSIIVRCPNCGIVITFKTKNTNV